MRSRLSHLFSLFGEELGSAIHSTFVRTQRNASKIDTNERTSQEEREVK